MRKVTLTTFIITTVLAASELFFCHSAMALEAQNNQYDSYCRTPNLEYFGDIDRSQTIMIGGVENPLYCTFVDNAAALDRLRKVVPEILSEIANEFLLDEINDMNWKDYKYASKNLPKSSSFWSERNEQSIILSEFFDIYEDTERNERIKHQVNQNITEYHTLSQSQKVELGMLLPNYAPLAQESNNIISTQRQFMTFALPNMSAAIAYAERYAVNPNSDGYGLAIGGISSWWSVVDCTNFVSQILEASGVGQVVYNNTNSGWWHKKNGDNHTYSVSWINADIFSEYMGVGYSTTNHQDFSHNIAKGDFITHDVTNNGSWDHMGFVTDVDTRDLCYLDGTYRDYKIAQHTKNYHDWASSDVSGWPTAAKVYGRVRR